MLVRPKSNKKSTQLAVQASTVTTLAVIDCFLKLKKSRGLGHKKIKRKRRTVKDIFSELGRRYVRKAYRMDEHSFWHLHKVLYGTDDINKRCRGATVNGPVLNSSRLSMALRWMAGGDKYDIAGNHGVGVNLVMESVWEIVNLVNTNSDLGIKFPKSYAAQQKVADGFAVKSSPQFNNCVGCIDGMLIWTDRPSENVKCGANVGSAKFFCGRKKKFGLVLQAMCDHHRRFIDIDISKPASTSDYLTFCTCDLLSQLLQPGYLKPGLTIYGDNAYVNTNFMTTPYKAVSGGIMDAFNFYHSQLRINIECAFGMLVHKWGCLRKPLPMNISLPKICALVKTLCILHNFCINERIKQRTTDNGVGTDCDSVLPTDMNSIILSGGRVRELLDNSNTDYDPEIHREDELLDVGHHFEDLSRPHLRQHLIEPQMLNGVALPRDEMIAKLQSIGYIERPKPMG